MIVFRPELTQLKGAIDRMRTKIYSDTTFLEKMKQAQEQTVEANVKRRFDEHKRYSHNPALTKEGRTKELENVSVEKIIKDNIQTAVIRRLGAKEFIVGTGRIEQMDSKDPIHLLNRPTPPKEGVTLWKILEYGSVPHDISAKAAPELYFYWKRWGKFFKGIKLPKGHPGTKGRGYFYKDSRYGQFNRLLYEEDKRVINRVRKAFKEYVERFSCRQ